MALPELPQEGDLSDRFYLHYAVDVQLLDKKGMEYEDKSPLQAVPLPVPGLGDHAGRLEPPAIGSIVELGFMFGQPDKLECLTQQIKVLEDRIAEICGRHTETVKGNRAIKAKNITEDTDITKFNGGKGVCTGASIPPSWENRMSMYPKPFMLGSNNGDK